MPDVRKYLDLSTLHLPLSVRTQETLVEGVVCRPFEDGIWMHVPAPEGDGDFHLADYYEGPLPDDVAAVGRVLVYAHDLGCSWILFDNDAEIDVELPVFDASRDESGPPHDAATASGMYDYD